MEMKNKKIRQSYILALSGLFIGLFGAAIDVYLGFNETGDILFGAGWLMIAIGMLWPFFIKRH